MRDYWLTQYLLAAVGWGYLIVSMAAVALALWLPKKKSAKAVAALIVLGLASIFPIQGLQGYLKEKEAAEVYQAKLAKAQALFAERCKTAGEKIYRTVAGVDGVVWLKWRPAGPNRDQLALDDPYGKDCSMEGCILRLLSGNVSTPSQTKYKFVETVNPVDGLRYRYTGVLKAVADVSKEEFSLHVKSTGYGANSDGQFLSLQRQPIHQFSARFGIFWADISAPVDREYWIAGGALKILDIQTNEVVAERVGYLIDTGQGSTAGNRDPWGWAQSYAPKCPRQTENSWDFVMRILHPTR
ncbi:MAG: hypothetical protein AB7I35_02260 [Ramlibacter sp.]